MGFLPPQQVTGVAPARTPSDLSKLLHSLNAHCFASLLDFQGWEQSRDFSSIIIIFYNATCSLFLSFWSVLSCLFCWLLYINMKCCIFFFFFFSFLPSGLGPSPHLTMQCLSISYHQTHVSFMKIHWTFANQYLQFTDLEL